VRQLFATAIITVILSTRLNVRLVVISGFLNSQPGNVFVAQSMSCIPADSIRFSVFWGLRQLYASLALPCLA
jgi:hypothetical protein